jgi:C_GCAxxG_C_C family probable redox protein
VAEEGSLRPGRAFWDEGYYCAESVLLAIAAELGVVSPLIPRIATGFCSGLARTGGMCGAVGGAIMGLGLGTGRDAPSDGVEECYALVTQLLGHFTARFGATACPQLLGCDVRTEEGRRSYEEDHLAERCRAFVEEATAMAVDLLEGKRRPVH